MRSLTIRLSLLIALAWPTAAIAQTPPLTRGNRFVAEVLSNLKEQVNVTAKLRQESRLRDQKLVGSGSYWQLGQLDKRLTRWEMRTQVADQTSSLLQIYDGQHLWTDRRLPSGRQVRRLDVALLQSRLSSIRKEKTSLAIEPLLAAALGRGGLRALLADMLRNFDFQPPQPVQLNGAAVHALIGHWKPEQLLEHWPAAEQLVDPSPSNWPEQLPHHLLLLVRSNMFPCVCEYRRAAAATLATNLVGLRPAGDFLLRYEIYEVQFAVAIPAEKFNFVLGDVQWTDETALVFEQLTKGSEEKQQPASASRAADSLQR